MKLIPIIYHNKKYPSYIKSNIEEIAGHLDKVEIKPKMNYSLHTEYSHMKRELNSPLIEKYRELKNSHKNKIPELWKSKKWAIEFANFIIDLINNNKEPEIIEIHPPFDSYCNNINEFLDIYEEFEKIIINKYPDTKIFIENRCGTFYTGGNFLISNSESIIKFLKELKNRKLKLKLVLDYPQVFSAEKIKLDNIDLTKIKDFNKNIKEYIDYIGGFHIWGKRKTATDKRWTPHTGTLNTFFSYNNELKNDFLKSILSTFDDNNERYFVPEVNSGEEDLQSIITDLIDAGFTFPIIKDNNSLEDYKQIISIEWKNKEVYFNVYDTKTNTFDLIKINGIRTIEKGNNKRCIGFKNLITRNYVPCKHRNITKEKQCFECKNLDEFSYCVICNGENCRNHSKNALNRCNENHYVYLTYFSKDKIKVGTAFHDRKEKRLLEQGAPYAYLIAKTPTGKLAREIEHQIVGLGYAEMVNSNYKAKNLILDNEIDKIKEILNNNITKIKDSINEKYMPYFIDQEEFNNTERFNKVKPELIKNQTVQTSLFEEELIDLELEKIDCFIKDKLIIEVIGNIAIIKDDEKYKYINLKDLIGWEYLNII